MQKISYKLALILAVLLLAVVSAFSFASEKQGSAATPENNIWQLLAAGERSAMLTVTETNETTPHNGSEFYFNDESMGFAPGGAIIYQDTADGAASGEDWGEGAEGITNIIDDTTPLRLSWHTSETHISDGWRVGADISVGDEVPRAVYHADTLPSYYPSGPRTNVPEENLIGWTLCYDFDYGTSVDFDVLWTACDGDYLLLAGGEGEFVPEEESEQQNVSSMLSPITNQQVDIELDEACEITTFDIKTEEGQTSLDLGFEYPVGLVNFAADCGDPGYETNVKLYFYNLEDASFVARKHNPNTGAYFNVENATIGSETIDDLKVLTLSYTIKDGGAYDSDGVENGTIIDPVGLGQVAFLAPQTGGGGTALN